MSNPIITQDDVLKYLRNVPAGITFVHGKAVAVGAAEVNRVS